MVAPTREHGGEREPDRGQRGGRAAADQVGHDHDEGAYRERSRLEMAAPHGEPSACRVQAQFLPGECVQRDSRSAMIWSASRSASGRSEPLAR